jgi:hypothetical protein
VIEGLRPAPTFNHRVEYGQMWHVCEEAMAAGADWGSALTHYCRGAVKAYRLQANEVDKWYNVCLTQFPIYVNYWAKHPDVAGREKLVEERVFDVAYRLPSGRAVRLRGKWDSVDVVRGGPNKGVWLQENKTKGDVRPDQMRRQLTFDLQTMLYVVALEAWGDDARISYSDNDALKFAELRITHPLRGVRYNVIRRPLSGGKGTIVRHKAKGSKPEETKTSYYNRLAGIIKESVGEFFMRWNVEVAEADVTKFRRECLDPILEQLCDWWEWISMAKSMDTGPDNQFYPFTDFRSGSSGDESPKIRPWVHWRHPFGVFNVLDEGGSTDLDECLLTGSEVGLVRVDNLFPELS